MLKPTIVFVTGAWHGPELYAPLTSALETAGYTVSAPVLPSIGGKQKDFKEDVSAVREAVKSATEAGNDVILLMHSYGGVVGSEAAEGFTRLDRQSGSESGSVVRMVYLCAFVLPEKKSLMNGLGGQALPWWEAVEDDTQYKAINCHEIFYNDVDKEVADKMISGLKPHAKGVFSSKVTYAAWKHILSVYIICEKDNAIALDTQESMATQPGNKITVERMDCGHSPWLSNLDGTVKLVRKAIGEKV